MTCWWLFSPPVIYTIYLIRKRVYADFRVLLPSIVEAYIARLQRSLIDSLLYSCIANATLYAQLKVEKKIAFKPTRIDLSKMVDDDKQQKLIKHFSFSLQTVTVATKRKYHWKLVSVSIVSVQHGGMLTKKNKNRSKRFDFLRIQSLWMITNGSVSTFLYAYRYLCFNYIIGELIISEKLVSPSVQ